jgi:ribosomal protein L32
MATALSAARQAQAPVVDDRDRLRHEDYCSPLLDVFTNERAAEIRVESFPYYSDDPATGKSRITHRITRCIECGATFNREIGA